MIPTGSYLLVLHKDESTVAYIHPETGETVRTIPVDLNPHEATLSRDGRFAYVSCAGGNTVAVIDVKQGEVVQKIAHPDFKFPHGMDVTHDNRWLWLVSTYANKLFFISIPEHRVERVLPLHQSLTHMVHMTPSGERAYIANIGSHNITIMDVASQSVVTHLPVGKGPEGLALHPDGKHVYVANQEENTLFVLSTETHEVLWKRRLGTLPVRAVFTPDGRYCLVPNRESHDLSVVAHMHKGATPEPSPWEIKRIPVGRWPGGVVVRPDGSEAYVANNKTNDISVIDLQKLKEVRRIDCGIHPDGIAWVEVG
ncbi:MAG: YncE family protein [Bacillota bacterium]